MSLAELKYDYGIDEGYDSLYLQAERAISQREISELLDALLSIEDEFENECENLAKIIRILEMEIPAYERYNALSHRKNQDLVEIH